MKSSKSKFKISHLISIVMIALLGFVFTNSTLFHTEELAEATYEFNSQNAPPITVTPDVPADIFTDGTAANKANLTQAANFAWNEFIALNWPYKKGNRDVPDKTIKFGSQNGKTPLVWHTYRHKVETYPGHGNPPGYNASAPDYGYNTASPKYIYDPAETGTPDGSVNPCTGMMSSTTPWINLDEKNEIGAATMYAGVSKGAGYPDPQILFLAKSNESEYKYSAKNKWWAGGNGFGTARKNTEKFVKKYGKTPPYSATDNTYVSFPAGTIEVKTAWRRLTNEEIASKRFYSTTVRYYKEGTDDNPCYVDDEFGMIALHIIHKTPTAPYFIYATFEQADNILTTDGKPVEDADGNIIANQHTTPTTPALKVTNATATTPQMFSPMSAHSTPENSLYYINLAGLGTPQGTITYNRRYNSIPAEVISANKNAHMLISKYNTQNNINSSPWEYYKLINVQYAPLDKAPGVDYTGPRRSEYYLSNSVVESDYVLQMFSGALAADFTTTDYEGSATAYNTYYDKPYLMGGCMGCHGNATNKGRDYSFIIGKPVKEPEYAQPVKLTDDKVKSLIKVLE